MKKVCMKLNNAFENDSRVMKEATSLSRAGYEVVIIAKHKEGLKEVEAFGGFTVKRIIKSNPLPLWDILSALYRERADIYHAHDLDSLPPAFLIAKLRGAKIVYDSHEYWRGFDESKINWKRRIFLFLEKYMVPQIDLLISVNESIVNKIANNYDYCGKKIVLYNAPIYKADTGESPIKPRTKYSIIHIGAIQNGRGVDLVLDVLGNLSKDFSLYLLGPDTYKGGFGKVVKEKKLEDRVFMLGSVDGAEVTRYASFADISIVLTQNISENYYLSLPNKLFESILAGLPVVTSDMLEISKLVNTEEVGMVCDINNLGEVRFAIEAVIKDVSKYKRNAKKAALKYGWQNQEMKLLGAYEEI